MALPDIKVQLKDGNLERAAVAADLHKHLVVIGTATDGPMHELVTVESMEDAKQQFGVEGSLFKGIQEAFAAHARGDKEPFISGMRIGVSVSNRAELSVKDTNGNEVLILEALNPGSMYNMVSFNNDTSRKLIRIYNTKSGKFSEFSYDLTSPTNTLVDIHNAAELADAINTDANLRGILRAAIPDKFQRFEVEVTDTANFIESTDVETAIDLSAMASGDFMVAGDRYLDGVANDPDLNALNIDGSFAPIVELNDVYTIVDSGVEQLHTKGQTRVRTVQFPKDGKNDARFNTILNLTQNAGSFTEKAQASDMSVISEGFLRYRNEGIGSYEAGALQYTFDAPFSLASTTLGDPAGDYATAEAFGGYAGADLATFEGKGTFTVNGIEYDALLEMRPEGGGANDWEAIDPAIYPFEFTWADGQVTMTFTADTPGAAYDNGDMRISFDSCRSQLTEHATLNSLEASNGIDQYFVRGNEMLFGSPLPADLVIRYASIRHYEIGANLTLSDRNEGVMKIIGRGIQPGSAGGAIGTDTAIIGFDYRFVSGFPQAGSASLSGGTNGTQLTTNQLYDELEEAYDALHGSQFEALVVPGAYIDATKTGYGMTSGMPQEVNAQFHNQMAAFLDAYNGEAVGVMAFKPLQGSGMNGRVTKADVAERALKLTTPDADDTFRAANFLQDFASQWMIAVDVEAVFGIAGQSYMGTAEAAIAGFYASKEADETIYVNEIPGINALRYRYANRIISGIHNGKSQLDTFSDMRIIAALPEGAGVRLTDGPTLADFDSDWDRLSTLSIVQEAVGRVRRVSRPYLGKFSSLENIKALDTACNSTLQKMVPSKLRALNVTIQTSPEERRIGRLTIDVRLVTQFEIRDIQIPVSLALDESQLEAASELAA